MSESTDAFAAWEKAGSPSLDTAAKMERARAAGIQASHRGLPAVPAVQKSPPERVARSPAASNGAAYDPLIKLMRTEKSLLEAAARGDHIAEELQQVRNSIRALNQQREQENDGGRRR